MELYLSKFTKNGNILKPLLPDELCRVLDEYLEYEWHINDKLLMTCRMVPICYNSYGINIKTAEFFLDVYYKGIFSKNLKRIMSNKIYFHPSVITNNTPCNLYGHNLLLRQNELIEYIKHIEQDTFNFYLLKHHLYDFLDYLKKNNP